MEQLKKELIILKKLGFSETTPLTFSFVDWQKGTLYITYDKETLKRKSWAHSSRGDTLDKKEFMEYTLFKMRANKDAE